MKSMEPNTSWLSRIIRPTSTRIIPGMGLSLGITIALLSICIIIPLGSVFSHGLSLPWDTWKVLLTKANVVQAFKTSLGTAAIAAAINVVFGFILAWVLVRYTFPGKALLNSMIELPFALPTAVAGITLSKLYTDTGWFGSILSQWGIHVAYSQIGIVVALVFVGIPFVVRSLEPVLETLDPIYEEAAFMMGASKFRLYRQVIFPELLPPLLTGFSLAFARGIGEYGSIIYILGNSFKNHTQAVSYVIMQKLNYADYSSATAIAIVLLGISFSILLVVNLIQNHHAKRIKGR